MDLGRLVRLHSTVDVADHAAAHAVLHLRRAIARHGRAVWVLAGGSSPTAAYRRLATRYAEEVEWTRVTAVIGDERMVPHEDPDSNLGAIERLLAASPLAAMEVLRPRVDLEPEAAADAYADLLRRLEPGESTPRIDLVWLGMGEDGHSLSLFPGHPAALPTDRLVIPVRDSPKPPSSRITLTPAALERVGQVLIFATGASKQPALAKALGDGELPVARVAAHTRAHGAGVTWALDPAVRD